MNPLVGWFLKMFEGNNTTYAGLGLWGLAFYNLTRGEYNEALEAFLFGWSALGLRNTMFKTWGK